MFGTPTGFQVGFHGVERRWPGCVEFPGTAGPAIGCEVIFRSARNGLAGILTLASAPPRTWESARADAHLRRYRTCFRCGACSTPAALRASSHQESNSTLHCRFIRFFFHFHSRRGTMPGDSGVFWGISQQLQRAGPREESSKVTAGRPTWRHMCRIAHRVGRREDDEIPDLRLEANEVDGQRNNVASRLPLTLPNVKGGGRIGRPSPTANLFLIPTHPWSILPPQYPHRRPSSSSTILPAPRRTPTVRGRNVRVCARTHTVSSGNRVSTRFS